MYKKNHKNHQLYHFQNQKEKNQVFLVIGLMEIKKIKIYQLMLNGLQGLIQMMLKE